MKARTKVTRGLKKRETAKLITDGWLVHYNFFRPHEALGDKTPAQKAGIKFPFKDWMDVVRGSKGVSQKVAEDKPCLKAYPSRASPKRKRQIKSRKHKPPQVRQISLAGVRMPK